MSPHAWPPRPVARAARALLRPSPRARRRQPCFFPGQCLHAARRDGDAAVPPRPATRTRPHGETACLPMHGLPAMQPALPALLLRAAAAVASREATAASRAASAAAARRDRAAAAAPRHAASAQPRPPRPASPSVTDRVFVRRAGCLQRSSRRLDIFSRRGWSSPRMQQQLLSKLSSFESSCCTHTSAGPCVGQSLTSP